MTTRDLDPAARFRELLGEYEAALVRLCRHYEADTERRRDLLQEIVLAIWQALPRFRGESSERTWLFRIAHNVAITWVTRAAKRHAVNTVGSKEDVEEAPTAQPLERQIEQRAELRRLSQKIRRLELVNQQIILLHLEGLRVTEIAEVTGLSQTNVTTRLSRVRKALVASEGRES